MRDIETFGDALKLVFKTLLFMAVCVPSIFLTVAFIMKACSFIMKLFSM